MQLSTLEKALQDEREQREEIVDVKEYELRSLETKILNLVRDESENRKMSEQRLLVSIEEKSEIVRDEISKESENREANIE